MYWFHKSKKAMFVGCSDSLLPTDLLIVLPHRLLLRALMCYSAYCADWLLLSALMGFSYFSESLLLAALLRYAVDRSVWLLS